jgi:predicted nucleic acid-binding protein
MSDVLDDLPELTQAARSARRFGRPAVSPVSASDLMIAATAASNELPLYTANPDDFKGAEAFVEVIGLRARTNNL